MATISGGAPMLGFLGTVTGMVRAFYEMANAGSGNIDITLLSGGIYFFFLIPSANYFAGSFNRSMNSIVRDSILFTTRSTSITR